MLKEQALTHEEETRVGKALVILFPDTRATSEGDRVAANVSILIGDFRKTVSELLERYKKMGFKVYAIVYRDTNDANFSGLYPREKVDRLVKWDQTFGDWGEEDEAFHKSYQETLPQFVEALDLKNGANVVVGGFHAGDCVAKFVAHLRNNGYNATFDLRLTDQLPFLLVSHQIRRMLPSDMVHMHQKDSAIVWKGINERVESLINKRP